MPILFLLLFADETWIHWSNPFITRCSMLNEAKVKRVKANILRQSDPSLASLGFICCFTCSWIFFESGKDSRSYFQTKATRSLAGEQELWRFYMNGKTVSLWQSNRTKCVAFCNIVQYFAISWNIAHSIAFSMNCTTFFLHRSKM